DQAQQSGFPCSRRARHKNEFAVINTEINIGENIFTAAIRFKNVLELDHRDAQLKRSLLGKPPAKEGGSPHENVGVGQRNYQAVRGKPPICVCTDWFYDWTPQLSCNCNLHPFTKSKQEVIFHDLSENLGM